MTSMTDRAAEWLAAQVLPGFGPGYFIFAAVISVSIGVAVLVAIGMAEKRSRIGERERVEAIRLQISRQGNRVSLTRLRVGSAR